MQWISASTSLSKNLVRKMRMKMKTAAVMITSMKTSVIVMNIIMQMARNATAMMKRKMMMTR